MSIRPTECEWAREDLSALLDGELAPEREAFVRAHVAGCSRCRAKLASHARVDSWLARVPVPELGADAFARVRARIAADDVAEAARAVAPRSAPPARRRWRTRGLVAAAVAAAAALALYLALPRPRTPLLPAPEPRVARAPEPVPQPQQQPVPSPAPPAAPPTQVAERPVPKAPVAPSAAATTPAHDPELDALAAEEIAVGLELDTAEDLEVIANLELLEALVALEGGRG